MKHICLVKNTTSQGLRMRGACSRTHGRAPWAHGGSRYFHGEIVVESADNYINYVKTPEYCRRLQHLHPCGRGSILVHSNNYSTRVSICTRTTALAARTTTAAATTSHMPNRPRSSTRGLVRNNSSGAHHSTSSSRRSCTTTVTGAAVPRMVPRPGAPLLLARPAAVHAGLRLLLLL